MAIVELGRRERKKQALRDSIRQETLQLVSRHGIDGTTIDAICDCVDIAKMTFYNYYASKHELLIDICQTALLDRLDATLGEALATGRDLSGQLDYLFDGIAERNASAGALERELVEYMVGNLGVNPRQGAGQLTMMNQSYRRFFEHHQAELRPGLSPEFCAEMTVSMSNGITLNWMHQDHYDAESRYRELAAFLKSSLLAKSGGRNYEREEKQA